MEFQNRNILEHWIINVDDINKYGSWQHQSGGISMVGGGSSVIKIPKSKFKKFIYFIKDFTPNEDMDLK